MKPRVTIIYCCVEHGLQLLMLDPRTHLPIASVPFTKEETTELSEQFRKAERAMNLELN